MLATDGKWLNVKFGGWQQEGAERVFYAAQGKRIFAAALSPFRPTPGFRVHKVSARRRCKRA